MANRYSKLPDYMETSELAGYFERVINKVMSAQKLSMTDITSFAELAIRQWHTYELLEITLKNKIDQLFVTYLSQFKQLETEDFANKIIRIIGCLGLIESYQQLKEIMKTLSPEANILLQEGCTEIKEMVHDPYYSLRK